MTAGRNGGAPRNGGGRTVGYVRVSTEEQVRGGISLDAQEARIRHYAAAKNLELIEILRDEGLSGKSLDRPGIQQLLASCRGGDVRDVIVVKLDRLTRRTRDLLFLVEDVFHTHDIALHSLHETVDTSNASGRFFIRIMGALAEMERELIGERTAAALAYKRSRGERLGTTPMGFHTPGPGEAPIPIPEELQVIKRILTRWRRGWSFRRIATAMNTEGVKTKRGGRWHHSTVRGVVKRRASYRPYLDAI